MRELQLDAIHDDGEHIVLTDSDGEHYTLRIDEALRAAVRRDKPALGLIQSAERTPLRPREIQALLRAGHDAEEIVKIADIDIEHVHRFEGPVLAEREFAAQRARAFPVGRAGGPTLAEVAGERLRARQAGTDLRWDAWRREDGTWTVSLTFAAGGRTREAHWQADMTRQSVVADDDEARWLTDDDTPDPDAPRPRARLTAVRGRVYDVEADGGVEHESAGAPRSGPWRSVRPASREAHPSTLPDDELDALNARRGLRPVGSAPRTGRESSVWSSVDGTDEAGSITSAASPAASEPAASPVEADPDAEAATEHSAIPLPSSATDEGEDAPVTSESLDGADTTEDEGHDAPESPAAEPAAEKHGDTIELTPLPGFDDPAPGTSSGHGQDAAAPDKPARRGSRSKRATMPSWDEIVFGSKTD